VVCHPGNEQCDNTATGEADDRLAPSLGQQEASSCASEFALISSVSPKTIMAVIEALGIISSGQLSQRRTALLKPLATAPALAACAYVIPLWTALVMLREIVWQEAGYFGIDEPDKLHHTATL
jgi:hypothetical protein